MIHRFAVFEVSEETREIRRDGRVIEMADLHFGLLLHLIRNQDRVVTERELLRTFWTDEDMAVASALQRAIRAIRDELSLGGADLCIRTYPRLGYRFCPDEGPGDAFADAPLSPALAFARSACEDGLWELALDGFAEADLDEDLGIADLVQWAETARCAARPEEAIPPLERALALGCAGDDRIAAAQAAITLARLHFESRAVSAADSYLKRARILLAESGPSRERAHAEWLQCRMALAGGRLDTATRSADRLRGLAERPGDRELLLAERMVRGRLHFAAGNDAQGQAVHDEAARYLMTDSIPPMSAGLVYSELIQTARDRNDWRRAVEWTREFARWCAASGVHAYTPLCRLHRAAVDAFEGRLTGAARSLNGLCESLADCARWMEGEAFRLLGDVHTSLGDLDTAEKDYHEARRLGWDPQPGEAQLLLLSGDAEAALHGLEASLRDAHVLVPQRRGLLEAHRVMALLAVDRREDARAALEALRPFAGLDTPPILAAWVHRALAEFAFSQGEGDGAVMHLQRSLACCEAVHAPLHAAAVRLCLAQTLAATGEPEKARTELDAAETVFRQSEAALYVEQAMILRSALPHRA